MSSRVDQTEPRLPWGFLLLTIITGSIVYALLSESIVAGLQFAALATILGIVVRVVYLFIRAFWIEVARGDPDD